jgi:RNA polymerase sigma-70 factor, ECF subfamily
MLPALEAARHEFLALVADVRPELHRYCARLTGSVFDGEDLVQDTLARAFYALSMTAELPPLRPWLFRIAHNAAIDHLRLRRREALDDDADLDLALDASPDPETARRALGAFLALPVRQRSAVILKDVLDLSLDEIALAIGSTVPAVKAALVRGRAALRAQADPIEAPRAPAIATAAERALLDRYLTLFNARDWPALRELLAADARLEVVAQARRDGAAVGEYFGRYAAVAPVRAELGEVEGRWALRVFDPIDAARPSYVILLTWRDGLVIAIRDYRYARYVLDEA